MKVLVINSGSSSVKFQVIETGIDMIEQGTEKVLAKGGVEKIGMTVSALTYKPHNGETYKKSPEVLEHVVAINKILQILTDKEVGIVKDIHEIEAVGHRVVHGGEHFSQSVVITDEVLNKIKDCCSLAPLHNPHNIKGYEAAHQSLPEVPHVAVFDTSFHQSMPDYAYIYGLPYILYKRSGVRRYGFHGTSHRYVSWRYGQVLGTPREEMKMITVHLGNGCSMAAIDHGRSIDTSMGLTPLEGLLMGTRSGDIDPAIILHVMAQEGLSLHEANTMLNKHSGLAGISAVGHDMRELLSEADDNYRAQLAINVYCYRVKKYIGAYMAALNGADAIIFTGGVGENANLIRQRCCEGLDGLGIEFDHDKNEILVGEGCFSKDSSRTKLMVIPTNEELLIARDTVRCMAGVANPGSAPAPASSS